MQDLPDPIAPSSSPDTPAPSQSATPDGHSEPQKEGLPATPASPSSDAIGANLEALNAQDCQAAPARDLEPSGPTGREAPKDAGGAPTSELAARSIDTEADHAPRPAGEAPAIDRPGAELIPFVAPARRDEGAGVGRFRRFISDKRLRWGAAAASVALIVASGAAVMSQDANSRRSEIQALQESVGALQAKIETAEAAKPNDEAASIRKALAEARGGLASSRDLSATIAQLNARIDRLEHDEGSRVDKLAERLDRETAARSAEAQAHDSDLAGRIDKLERADLTLRVDKLEKKQASSAAASATVATPAAPAANKPGETTSPTTSVSNETTGSIVRPQPSAPIRGWVLHDIRNGEALVENRQGLREISPGETLPGAGRVERFERRGRQWVVVTDQGVILQGSFGGPVGDGRPPAFVGGYGGYGAYYGGYGDGEY
jgi:hypothetical protein